MIFGVVSTGLTATFEIWNNRKNVSEEYDLQQVVNL